MNIILLSGGSGKRLWPLSNDVRSKQFLKLLVDDSGERQSMVQRVYGQIKEANPNASITVATGASQVDSIQSQLHDAVDIVLEPERRDTFPAIVLASIFLALEKGVGMDEAVVVLPVDPYTEVEFFRTLGKMEAAVNADVADIVLMGISPTEPTSKYGYILPEGEISDGVFGVSRFVEKPDEQAAQDLIDRNAFWNGGVFAFRLGYLMDIARSQMSFGSFAEARKKYGELDKISFDYKVVEKAVRIAVIPYKGMWTDIGTWLALTEKMAGNVLGPALVEASENTYVVNELDTPVVVLGAKDTIVSASPDGILVSGLAESSNLKPLVDKLENTRPMYEERRWGEYTVLEQCAYAGSSGSLVKHLTLHAGKSVSYQSHKSRDEVWTVTNGEADFVLDGAVRRIAKGDVVSIKRGQKHAMRAICDIDIVEVQLGHDLVEDDIERHEWEWK